MWLPVLIQSVSIVPPQYWSERAALVPSASGSSQFGATSSISSDGEKRTSVFYVAFSFPRSR
jgi:hypothetical protein